MLHDEEGVRRAIEVAFQLPSIPARVNPLPFEFLTEPTRTLGAHMFTRCELHDFTNIPGENARVDGCCAVLILAGGRRLHLSSAIEQSSRVNVVKIPWNRDSDTAVE